MLYDQAMGLREAVRAAPLPVSGDTDSTKGAGLGAHPEVSF